MQHVNTATFKLLHQPTNGLIIAGNRFRTENDCVSLVESEFWVAICGKAMKRRADLALTARCQGENFSFRQVIQVVRIDGFKVIRE